VFFINPLSSKNLYKKQVSIEQVMNQMCWVE
jgi:hypothetical protein